MFAEDPSGQSHCAERAEQLERLGKGDTDFLDGNVIKNMRHRMQVTAEIARTRFMNQLTSTGVATFPKAQVRGKSRTEVMKLMRPKLRMAPSRADGRFTRTP